MIVTSVCFFPNVPAMREAVSATSRKWKLTQPLLRLAIAVKDGRRPVSAGCVPPNAGAGDGEGAVAGAGGLRGGGAGGGSLTPGDRKATLEVKIYIKVRCIAWDVGSKVYRFGLRVQVQCDAGLQVRFEG